MALVKDSVSGRIDRQRRESSAGGRNSRTYPLATVGLVVRSEEEETFCGWHVTFSREDPAWRGKRGSIKRNSTVIAHRACYGDRMVGEASPSKRFVSAAFSASRAKNRDGSEKGERDGNLFLSRRATSDTWHTY